MKCEYCGIVSFVKNARGGVECSGCGAPPVNELIPGQNPIFVLKTDKTISVEAKARLTREWHEMFSGSGSASVGKLVILDQGMDLILFNKP